jgi:hypothetical protein
MKTIKHFLFLGILLITVASCSNPNSKSSTWSDQQKTQWKEKCMELLIESEVPRADAESTCDCMLEKTSEKYTPEEAAKIDLKGEQELWQDCDYQW